MRCIVLTLNDGDLSVDFYADGAETAQEEQQLRIKVQEFFFDLGQLPVVGKGEEDDGLVAVCRHQIFVRKFFPFRYDAPTGTP